MDTDSYPDSYINSFISCFTSVMKQGVNPVTLIRARVRVNIVITLLQVKLQAEAIQLTNLL